MFTRTVPAALALVAAAVVTASSQGSPPAAARPADVPQPGGRGAGGRARHRQQDRETGDGPRAEGLHRSRGRRPTGRPALHTSAVRRHRRAAVSRHASPPPAPAAPASRAPSPPTFTPQANRVFLFVLGSGRLQEPSKGLDAAVDFVRTRLGPKDQVAAFAWNRATAFTTDHVRVARVIERLREENDAIDQEVRADWSGLARPLRQPRPPEVSQGPPRRGSSRTRARRPGARPSRATSRANADRTKGRLEDAMDKALAG